MVCDVERMLLILWWLGRTLNRALDCCALGWLTEPVAQALVENDPSNVYPYCDVPSRVQGTRVDQVNMTVDDCPLLSASTGAAGVANTVALLLGLAAVIFAQ